MRSALSVLLLMCAAPALSETGQEVSFLPRYGSSVELSPRLDELWPGGKYWNVRLWDIKQGGFLEADVWDRVTSVVVEQDTLYDDGMHLDGDANDLLYGYCSLDDVRRFTYPPTYVEFRLSDGEARGGFIDYEVIEAGPLASFPEPTSPPPGGSVDSTTPTLHWRSVEGADVYGIILWDRTPTPEGFLDDMVWGKGDLPGDVTSVSMKESATPLEYGETYWWAVWAVNTTQKPHEGLYAGTYPYYVMDVGWFRVERGPASVRLESWGSIKTKAALTGGTVTDRRGAQGGK